MFNPRTIAIAGSIAALSLAATPVALAAAPHHDSTRASSVDRSRDSRTSHRTENKRDSKTTSKDTRSLR